MYYVKTDISTKNIAKKQNKIRNIGINDIIGFRKEDFYEFWR